MDLRVRIMKGIEEGQSVRVIGSSYSVSPSCVVKLTQLFRRTGSLEPKSQGGDRRSHGIEVYRDWLFEQISTTPDLTLEEIRVRLLETKGFVSSISAVWRFFNRHGISFKKNGARRRTGANRCSSGSDRVAGESAQS